MIVIISEFYILSDLRSFVILNRVDNFHVKEDDSLLPN